jgi:hypothetical protein
MDEASRMARDKPAARHRLAWHWIVGGLTIFCFVTLFSVRVGIFQKSEGKSKAGSPSLDARTMIERDIWMKISQRGQRIGFAHRTLFKTGEGYRVAESVFMQVNMMGMVQEIRFSTEGNFDPRMVLSSFQFELRSGLFDFRARGSYRRGTLTVFAGPSGSERKVDFPLENEVFLPVGMLDKVNPYDWKLGSSRTFQVFDPATQALRPVKVTALSEESLVVEGRQELCKKISVDFMGAPQFAWVGKDRTIVREEGSLGIQLEQVAREEALETGHLTSGTDLGEMASIPANRILRDPGQLHELKVRLEGIEALSPSLVGARQTVQQGVLRIRKESLSNLPASVGSGRMFEDGRTYLETTPFIQADHPAIRSTLKSIVSEEDPPVIKARKLVGWVNENIEKRPVLSVPNALETLRNRVGDCNEHAVLLAALARTAGIPAEVEAGLVYRDGRFYYHAWNILHLGTWVTADAALGQFPADVTHIRFVRGAERQIDLLGVIGKLRIEILESL